MMVHGVMPSFCYILVFVFFSFVCMAPSNLDSEYADSLVSEWSPGYDSGIIFFQLAVHIHCVGYYTCNITFK